MDKTNYTYIIRCSDGTLYTGWTTDVERRVRTHNSGNGAKYTRSRLPVTLVYYETYPTKQEAMRREWEIKQLTREENHCLKDEEYKKALFQRIEAIQLLDMIDCVKGKGKEKYVLKKIIEQ